MPAARHVAREAERRRARLAADCRLSRPTRRKATAAKARQGLVRPAPDLLAVSGGSWLLGVRRLWQAPISQA